MSEYMENIQTCSGVWFVPLSLATKKSGMAMAERHL